MTLHSFLAVSADYLFGPPAAPVSGTGAAGGTPELSALLLSRELARLKTWRRLATGEPAAAVQPRHEITDETAA